MKKESVIANKRPAASVPRTDSPSPVPRRGMRQCMAIGVAAVALLAACATPIASADYPADKKKYDDCVAREKERTAGAPTAHYLETNIRNFCGEPPTPPRNEKR